jgi:hypothetical protein
MPSKKPHQKINFIIWLLILLFFLRQQHLIYIVLFSTWMYLFTVKINPDWDVNTVLKHVTKHHGILHNPFFWLAVFIPQYIFLGSWTIGGFVGILGHLAGDWLFN